VGERQQNCRPPRLLTIFETFELQGLRRRRRKRRRGRRRRKKKKRRRRRKRRKVRLRRGSWWELQWINRREIVALNEARQTLRSLGFIGSHNNEMHWSGSICEDLHVNSG